MISDLVKTYIVPIFTEFFEKYDLNQELFFDICITTIAFMPTLIALLYYKNSLKKEHPLKYFKEEAQSYPAHVNGILVWPILILLPIAIGAGDDVMPIIKSDIKLLILWPIMFFWYYVLYFTLSARLALTEHKSQRTAVSVRKINIKETLYEILHITGHAVVPIFGLVFVLGIILYVRYM